MHGYVKGGGLSQVVEGCRSCCGPNVKPRTIYEMVAQKRIPYRKPPGSNILRFDLDEIIAWTKAGKNK